MLTGYLLHAISPNLMLKTALAHVPLSPDEQSQLLPLERYAALARATSLEQSARGSRTIASDGKLSSSEMLQMSRA